MAAPALFQPSRDDVIDLLSALVHIDSINPSLVPDAAGEGQIARYVGDWLEHAGLDVRVRDVVPGRPNVVARVPGRRGGRSLLLNAHMDTVGITGMRDPFSPGVDGDRLYGRGAYDMKGGLAAIMLAARALARAGGADGDVIVAAVMDEEHASLGMTALLQDTQADGAVVTEPTGLQLCTAHKGFAWLSIETRGRAAHGSKPDLGIDAIAHMGRVLIAMEALGRELGMREPHPLLGTASIHASLIEGGQEWSSYPERCKLQIERRTVPGETPEAVRREVQAHLEALYELDESFIANVELDLWRDPFEVGVGDDIVEAVGHAAVSVTGDLPGIYGDTPWMDAALTQAAGIPTVVFGPGGAGAHAVEEYASLSQVGTCAEILARTAIDFCQA